MNIYEIIKKAREECINSTGKQPTEIRLTIDDEAILESAGRDILGDLSEDIIKLGARDAIQLKHGGKLLGLTVIWDASETKAS